MIFSGLSDFASALRLQDNTRFLRQQMVRAGEELTTGQKSDIREATRGEYGPVFSIDRSLQRIEQRLFDLAEAGGRADASQSALERLQGLGSSLGDALSAAVTRGDMSSAQVYLRDAPAELETAVSALNTRFGGRYIFSGAADDTPPIQSAQQMVTDVQALIAAAPDAATALADIDTYFGAGGGFETTIYVGATQDAAGIELAEGNRRNHLVRADAQEVRDTLQGLVMAAAFDSADFGGNVTEQTAYLTATADQNAQSVDAMVAFRSVVGTSQNLISEAEVAMGAEKNALTIARGELAGVDQYEATARFVSLQAQLDTLYNVTARMSSLRFTNYL